MRVLVIAFMEPVQEASIEILKTGSFPARQKTTSDRPKPSFTLSPAFGLIRGRVNQGNPKRGCDLGKMLRTEDRTIVHIEPSGKSPFGECLAQTIQIAIKTLGQVELAMGNEPTHIIQKGKKKTPPLSTIDTHRGAIHHIALPQIIGKLCLKPPPVFRNLTRRT
jgi:hypothetical protein